jgi:hypothetical protein
VASIFLSRVFLRHRKCRPCSRREAFAQESLFRSYKTGGSCNGAGLRKETLLEVLSAEARSRASPRVTDRMLRDWIDEDLFPGPKEKGLGQGLGSEWRYSPAALRAALEVVRLKASSPERRNKVLRIRLWLLGFDVPMVRIVKDLKSEFRRLLWRRFFRNPFRYDASSGDDLSEREKETERRRAGPLDPTFIDAGWELATDDLLRLVWESVSDPTKASQFLKSLDALVSPYLSEHGQAIFAVFLSGLEPYVDVAGLFGAPDEIEKSGLEALAAINEGDLTKGRRLYQFALAMADCAARGSEFLPPGVPPALGEAASKTNRTLRESDEWCVAGLAVCSIAAHRAITPVSRLK